MAPFRSNGSPKGDLFPYTSPLQASLVQFGRFAASKRRYILVGVLLVLLWMFLFWTYEPHDLYNTAQGHLGIKHPVEVLHARAKAQFDALIARQSKTPAKAEQEYKRRYGRIPPPGFKKWAQYAISARSPIIDDFDMINEDVAPYFEKKAEQILDLMYHAANTRLTAAKGPDMVALCDFKNGQFDMTQENCRGNDWFVDMHKTLKGGMSKNIPDMKVLINYYDEPSVLPTTDHDVEMTWERRAGESIASQVHQACALREGTQFQLYSKDNTPQPPATVPASSGGFEDFGIPFVQDVHGSQDVCKHKDLMLKHGIYLSPSSADHINARVPLLTTGRPAPFADIVIPSPQYVWDKNLPMPGLDMNWKNKKNAVYWAGSNTGSLGKADRDSSWRGSHRQRFAARFANPRHANLTNPVSTYLRRTEYLNTYQAYQSDFLDDSQYNVALTGLIQCDLEACRKQHELWGGHGGDPPERAMEYKYNFDVDGNAYTNRFYRLLGSHSVPIKMTLWREWHDERLIPWLHYIPISMDLDEVPELVRFLTTTPEGDKVGEAIAIEGANWHDRALTGLHQGLYLYRLMLELAWLQDPARVPENSAAVPM